MSDQRFPKECHIRRGVDFRRVYNRRAIASDNRLLVFACENGQPWPRLGLSVSRKVGGAVVRNRWKRLIREAFRLNRPSLPSGIDLVVIPRPDFHPDLQSLGESLPRLAARAAKKLARLGK